ncbi:MAG TPA: DUF3237 domain-containing protein [Candidatus Acidoferrales bacterium]|nr:DUF3237 domain-containing protein [Candidatus Acidoferrales bacterium]
MKKGRVDECRRGDQLGSAPHSALGRRSVLKGSVLGGGAMLVGGLFTGLLPKPALAEGGPSGDLQAASPSGTDAGVKSLGEVVPIKLEYVFQIRIDFSERVSFNTPTGRRAYVPAISGVIDGPRLQGRVVPRSGADYAGNGRLNAHYMLQASDGTMIYINNTGYLYPVDGKPIDRSDPSWSGDREFYFRCTPVFDTPVGPHDWLTRTVIVGTAKRYAKPDHTIFTYYAVL